MGIRNRGSSYQVVIRKRGFTPVYKSFGNKSQAKKELRKIEDAMDEETWVDIYEQRSTLISSLIKRYIHETSVHKPISGSKQATLLASAARFEGVSVYDLDPEQMFKYGVERRELVSPHTLNLELTYMIQVVDTARTLWGVKLDSNPIAAAKSVMAQFDLVGGSKQRNRRLLHGELSLLTKEAGDHWIRPMIELAVHTCMREAEIHRMKWEDLNFDASTILIKKRKGKGKDMVIPMFKRAREVLLREYKVSKRAGNLWDKPEKAASISDKFAKVRKKLSIDDLTFHDLRHEGISRLFDEGMDIQQVAAVSGHSDWKQLARYTQLDLAKVLSSVDFDNH